MLNTRELQVKENVVLCKYNTDFDISNMNSKDLDNISDLNNIFANSKKQILMELSGEVDDYIIGNIEKIIQRFLISNGYYIHNFSFSDNLKKVLLFFRYIDYKFKVNYFNEIFINNFYKFLLGTDFDKIPNTQDGKLIAHIDGDNIEFRYHYNNLSKRNSRINELIDENKISIYSLIFDRTEDEIEEELEYNNYILDEMYDFIDVVSSNKDMTALDISYSDFKDIYKEIIDFFKNNQDYINELSNYYIIFLIAYGLFFHFSNSKFSTLNSYEEYISKSFSIVDENDITNQVEIKFNNQFYQELKFSLQKFINILNTDFKNKKNNFE